MRQLSLSSLLHTLNLASHFVCVHPALIVPFRHDTYAHRWWIFYFSYTSSPSRHFSPISENYSCITGKNNISLTCFFSMIFISSTTIISLLPIHMKVSSITFPLHTFSSDRPQQRWQAGCAFFPSILYPSYYVLNTTAIRKLIVCHQRTFKSTENFVKTNKDN